MSEQVIENNDTDLWGQHLILNFGGCPVDLLKSKENILKWGEDLVENLEVTAQGKPLLEHFAKDNFLAAGYSYVQLIETSNICAHFAENVGQLYIDVFSCKIFNETVALELCKSFFQPETVHKVNYYRGPSMMSKNIKGKPQFNEQLYNEVSHGFSIDKIIFESKSKYQGISIYENKCWGRILTLDGVFQTSTQDEYIQHETLSNVPIMSYYGINHMTPKSILIIGGGDGGVLRECLKHSSIESITMVEIDKIVVDLCIKYMGSINNNGEVYNDKRVNLVIDCGLKQLKNNENKFDIIIIDSTDPIGPGENLFTYDFYKLCYDNLNDNGILANQNGVPFMGGRDLRNTIDNLKKCDFLTTCFIETIPGYHGGVMSFGFGYKGKEYDLNENIIIEQFNKNKLKLKHYKPQLHKSRFILPVWIDEIIDSNLEEVNNKITMVME